MDLPDTVIAASIGALLGWLIKVVTDGLVNWTTERKLVNRAIYQLYLLVGHIDHLLNNYSIWSLVRNSDRRVEAWKSMFRDATAISITADIRTTALSIAEINPRLAFGLVSILQALEKILELMATAHESPDFDDSAKNSQMLLTGFRTMLQGIISELLLIRRFFRKDVSERMIRQAAERDRQIEKLASDVERKQTPPDENAG